jgi:dipeptidyl aminopeptidase/acylaminoacyl peptidase
MPPTVPGEPLRVELVARTRSVADPRWAPDGSAIAWVEGADGRGDVVVASRGGGAAPVVVTAPTPVAGLATTGGGAWCWAGAGRIVLAAAQGRLLVVPVDGGPGRVLVDEGRASAPHVAPTGDAVAFVIERDDACDVAVVGTGDDALLRRVSAADVAWDPVWSPDGTRLAWHEWDLGAMPWEASRIVVARPTGEDRHVVAGGPGVAVGQPRFSPDGSRLAWVSDTSGWSNVTVGDAAGAAPVPLAVEPYEHSEPAWGPGQRSFAWSPDSRAIAWCRNEEGFGRLVVAPVPQPGLGERAALRRPVELARGWHHGLDWGAGGIVAVRHGARTPPAVCVTSPEGPTNRQVLARGAPAGFETVGLVEPERVSWRGDDGEVVFGLLARPEHRTGSPPLLVDVHGGPTGQATAQWRPFVQYFVSRGWAVLAPDARGSSGHGRAYERALRGRWGELDVADVAAGVEAAGASGWGDPHRVAVCGGSAGGLTALLLAARRGELLRAVVTMYGVTDMLELAATTHRLESRYLDDLVGALPARAERYRERSPVTHAAAIRVPTLVLHGDADKVVRPEQAAMLVERIRAAGGVVEHHVYAGEGHGWTLEATVRDSYARIDDFLARSVLAP